MINLASPFRLSQIFCRAPTALRASAGQGACAGPKLGDLVGAATPIKITIPPPWIDKKII